MGFFCIYVCSPTCLSGAQGGQKKHRIIWNSSFRYL